MGRPVKPDDDLVREWDQFFLYAGSESGMTKEVDLPVKPEDDLGGMESGMTKENMDPPIKSEDDLGGDVKSEELLRCQYIYSPGISILVP